MSVAQPDQDIRSHPHAGAEAGWRCIVWNDPVNLMTYVTYVFQTHFGYSEAVAHRLMLQVHHEGKATLSQGAREKVEMDVQAMHTYGLWATMEQA